MEIEWDPNKARSNLRKHKVSFEEAATALYDTMSVTGADPDHSVGEFRYVTFGMSAMGRVLVISHTDASETIRIISARVASKGERNFMKKDKQTPKNELREVYKRADFSGALVRGKYAKSLREASNIVVLKPEVAAVFPNEAAVNKALKSLIAVAQATAKLTSRSSARGKKSCAA